MMALLFLLACDPTDICDAISDPPEIYVGKLTDPTAFGAELDTGSDSVMVDTSPRDGLIEVTTTDVILTYTDISGRTWQVTYEIAGQFERW
jgi:hypothetical protein